MGAEIIVIRHPRAGAPHLMAAHLDIPVINAGNGMHEHPTQALLDAYTILRHKKNLKGLRIAIVGDIYHSRIARSAIHLLSKFGSKITLCGPPEFLPDLATTLAPGLHISRTAEEAVHGADVVMVLRVQKERLAGRKISLQDYVARYHNDPAPPEAGKKRCAADASRPHHPRPGAHLGSSRLPPVSDR